MSSMRVVLAFDKIENRDCGLGSRLESVTIEELAFQSCVEALAHRVIKAVTNRFH